MLQATEHQTPIAIPSPLDLIWKKVSRETVWLILDSVKRRGA